MFKQGFKSIFPIIPGIIPFGAVMGTVCSEAQLSLLQTISMNFFIYGGASQVAALELMKRNAPIFVVVITALIINMRFLLYSAAMAPVFQHSKLVTKIFGSARLTDQSFAAISANESKLHSNADIIRFYFGSAVSMMMIWDLSVIAGYIFGNFAPPSSGLDYAIPLSFVGLVGPSLKNRKYLAVAIFSSAMSILLRFMPYNLGLITTAFLAIGLAAFLTRQPKHIT